MKIYNCKKCKKIKISWKNFLYSSGLCRTCCRVGKNNYWFGKHHKKETINKMKLAASGKNNHNFGKSPSKATREKMSKSRKGYKHTKQTINKIKKSNVDYHKLNPNSKKGENNPFFGRKHTTKTKDKIRNSDYNKNLKGKNNPMWGKHHSEATKLKQREAQIERFQDPKEREKISGENNSNYIHGLSKSAYSKEFTQYLRNEIKERDNYTCQCCGFTQEQHLEKYNRDIEIHHIDYDRENCNKNNLITTCKQCNINANHNRDYYYAYYTYKIEEKL
jgi:hypothetical protein